MDVIKILTYSRTQLFQVCLIGINQKDKSIQMDIHIIEVHFPFHMILF